MSIDLEFISLIYQGFEPAKLASLLSLDKIRRLFFGTFVFEKKKTSLGMDERW